MVSKELDYIANRPPKGIVMWGNLILVSLICLGITIGWFIKYPESISAKVQITSINTQNIKNINKTNDVIIAKIYAEPKNMLKIKKNQNVVIKLDKYGDHNYIVKRGRIDELFVYRGKYKDLETGLGLKIIIQKEHNDKSLLFSHSEATIEIIISSKRLITIMLDDLLKYEYNKQ